MSEINHVNGIICPALTFFNQDKQINLELTSLLLKHVLLNGANSILLFGTTGEGITFSNKLDEKLKLISFIYEKLGQKIPILSGIFQNDFESLINEIDMFGKKFKELIFLIPSPSTESLSDDDLNSFFVNILDSVNVNNRIMLYNNPTLFSGNNISPTIISNVKKYEKVIGIKDSSEKFGNYRGYIQFIDENFAVCCGKERYFSQFLQLIPKEKRGYSALIPSISNLVNVCKKLYLAALEEDPLKIEQYQEAINEFREKLYDIQNKVGKQQRGLKYSFYSLYKDSFDINLNEVMNFSPEFQKTVEKFTQYRIDVSLRYLLNLNYIDKLYPIGNDLFDFSDLKNKFSNITDINDLGVLKRVKGPYGRIYKNATIYRMKFNQDLVLRYYDSNPIDDFDICKEKVLYPFLDGSLNENTPELRTKIKNILSKEKGSYLFDPNLSPIIPVPNLIYFDETKTLFPCNYTIQEYIPGKPFYYYKSRLKIENLGLEQPKLTQFFKNVGKALATIHEIRFDYFYENINQIGEKSNGQSWYEIIDDELEYILAEAKKNKIDVIKDIRDYIKDNRNLIEEESEPVVIHNNFHGQNIIIKDEPTKIRINGILNFENWRVGVRAIDFASFEYMTLKMFRIPELKKAFFSGYEKYYTKSIDKDFLKKIEIYKLFFFLKEFNKNPINSGFRREINKILVEN